MVVVGVRAHEADEHDPVPVVDFRDQAVVVPPDVEDHAAVADDAGLGESGLDLRGRVPVLVFNRSVPGKQRCLSVGVLLPECPQGSFGDDTHG